MGCATGIVKYFVFLANLIFALAGLALIVIGILYQLHYSEVTDALPAKFGVAPILSIVIGAVVFITAFLGCCGAVKESTCMLTTYAIILLVIFIIQVAIGVYVFIKVNQDPQEFKLQVHQGLAKIFDGYKKNNEKTETVNAIQSLLHCCGLNDYNEMSENGILPTSCCRKNVGDCRSTNYNSFYNINCSAAVRDLLQQSSHVVGGVAIGIAVIEFHCCGVDGPDKYPNETLPNSCCPDEIRPCVKQEIAIYHNGCTDGVHEFVTKSSKIVGGVFLGIALAELLGAFFGLCLSSSLKNQYRSVYT